MKPPAKRFHARASRGLTAAALAVAALAVYGASQGSGADSGGVLQGGPGSSARQARTDTVAFVVPPDSLIPKDAHGASIRRGREILLATQDSLPRNVGNKLKCVSCHLDGGIRKSSGSWVGVYSTFPQYNPRSGRVFQIEDRINECFRRSLNGKPLALGSRDLRDLVAYFAFLSQGVPMGAKPQWLGLRRLKPGTGRAAAGGKQFAARCVECHGEKGEGTVAAPPLWGPESFAIGAGMARINTLAAFLRWNMPFDRPGTLDDQTAYDIAAFILSHPRPDTPGKVHDWPRGGRPEDCPYRTAPAAKGAGRKS